MLSFGVPRRELVRDMLTGPTVRTATDGATDASDFEWSAKFIIPVFRMVTAQVQLKQLLVSL